MQVYIKKHTKGLPPYRHVNDKALISYPESKILPVCVTRITGMKDLHVRHISNQVKIYLAAGENQNIYHCTV
jgi:hypothetical protein